MSSESHDVMMNCVPIFLVVAGVAGDAHDAIDAAGQFSEVHVLHGPSRAQGLLGIVQHVRHRVHAHL